MGVRFDGATDRYTTSGSSMSLVNINDEYTFFMSVRQVVDTGAFGVIASLRSGADVSWHRLHIFTDGDDLDFGWNESDAGGGQVQDIEDPVSQTFYWHVAWSRSPRADGQIDLWVRRSDASSWTKTVITTPDIETTTARIFSLLAIGQNVTVAPFDGEVFLIKMFDGVSIEQGDWTDDSAFDEIQFRNAQSNVGALMSLYKFESGALTVDSSGNDNTLNEAGTPTFVSDPSFILGDDPAQAIIFLKR